MAKPIQRTLRCKKCGGFLMKVTMVDATGLGAVTLDLETKCGNRRCRIRDQYTLKAENDDKAK